MSITLQLPNECTVDEINKVIMQMPTEQASKIHLKNFPVQNLNFTQIALLISLFRNATSKQKKEAVKILKSTIASYNYQGKLEESLELESLLYDTYLKYCENEKDYNDFYKEICKCYPISHNRYQLKGPNIAFFIHAPYLLAHVKPLLSMLKIKNNHSSIGKKLFILTLGSDASFENEFTRLNVEVINLNLDKTLELPDRLIKTLQSYEIGKLVWQCLPTFLPYVVSKIAGIDWWSMKFHPNIEGIQNYITNSDFNGSVLFNGRTWKKFTPPFTLKNTGKAPVSWLHRENKFAAFCREELIDNEIYWKLVNEIISKFKMQFYYTGKKAIHQKYVKLFNIPPTKIKFLGWPENPENLMIAFNFLLDGGNRGHGLMASEAISCGIPIIWPKNYLKAKHSRMKKIYSDARHCFKNISDENFYLAQYTGKHDLLQIIAKYCKKENENAKLASFQKNLLTYRNEGSFSDFLHIISPSSIYE